LPAGEFGPERALHTVCLQCNTGCGIRVRVEDGVAVKIEGNPYSPWTLVPSIRYGTALRDAVTVEGALCPKGQAGLQTLYDPYRLVRVLKRAGPRGSNRWKTIPFDRALQEIVEGGRLFREVRGEENRLVPGLRELWALRDPGVASEMAKAVEAIRSKRTPEEKRQAVEEFQKRFAPHLPVLIDPEHPDLGPRNNQLAFVWGRLKGGRNEFIRRFVQDSFGSVNAHGHTTVCQGSLYFTGNAMSDQFQEGKFSGGQKFYWQADTGHAEFLLAVGTAYIEGGYGPTHHARKLMERLLEGKVKIAVVDPRFSKIASKAWRWIPARPGSEAALALAMIRWIVDEGRYDVRFLSAANRAAAKQAGETTWTNAAWLVKEDGTFLRASEIGLPGRQTRTGKDGKEWEFDPFVVMAGGQPVPFDPNDEATPVAGDVLVDTTIGGVRVKSALRLIYESAASRSLAEWAELCGIEPGAIVELAREFTSHGKRAVADIHRGVSQHTNGFYAVLAFYCLNALVGNWDWKGGLVKATTYDILGGKPGQPWPLATLHPRKTIPFGISLVRHEVRYEESTLFEGYPARRNWYPFSSDLYQEIFPSIADAYPYGIRALFLYMASPAYALPGGQKVIEVLSDPEKIPLVVASDITIGETSMYADYIFPDLTYLERWEFHGSHPAIPQKVQPVRNPVVAPVPETVTVFGEAMPLSLEAMLLGLAERLGLPGFGPHGFGPDLPMTRPEDFYLKMVANLAAGEGPTDAVPEADDEEMRAFHEARRHLPKSVFDPERWKKAAGETFWRKVVYVLNRGGRFQDYENAYEGDRLANPYGRLVNLYLEKLARAKSSMTGRRLSGVPVYEPVRDVLGRPVQDDLEGYDLHLITFREVTETKTRTVADYWLGAVHPTNEILVSRADAERLGLRDGDRVRVVSRSNPRGVWDLKNGTLKPMVGVVKVTEGIRPGVVGFSLGKGHWAYGAADVWIDGKRIPADPRRATGVHANAAMRLDDHLGNTCLLDPVGGSVSFYDTRVRLVKEV